MSKEKTEKISFYKFFKKFPDEEAAHKFFAEKQWGKDEKNRFCPHCGGIRTTRTEHRMPYHCKDCRKRFSVRTGTILAESNIPLHKWLMAMYLLNTNLKGVSSMKLARDLDITQKTAWFLAHRIRKAFEDQQDAKFISDVEVDETWMGGGEILKHALFKEASHVRSGSSRQNAGGRDQGKRNQKDKGEGNGAGKQYPSSKDGSGNG